MSPQEITYCPRCNTAVQCKPGEITSCYCYQLKLTEEQRAYIRQRYTGCLCRDCLEAVSREADYFTGESLAQ